MNFHVFHLSFILIINLLNVPSNVIAYTRGTWMSTSIYTQFTQSNTKKNQNWNRAKNTRYRDHAVLPVPELPKRYRQSYLIFRICIYFTRISYAHICTMYIYLNINGNGNEWKKKCLTILKNKYKTHVALFKKQSKK